MTEAQILIFIVTSLVLIITPGQDMILVMSRSISQGWKAGVATAAGVSTGLLGHTLLAALGLGAILQASELLFTIMKIGGAAYLIYMGIRLILSSHSGLDINNLPALSTGKLFFREQSQIYQTRRLPFFILHICHSLSLQMKRIQ